MARLSIVFPIFNEIKNPLFWKSLENFSRNPNLEIIIVDGGSDDGTQALLKESGYSYIEKGRTRAARLNIGVQAARGEVILLHHPRSLIGENGIQNLLMRRVNGWGGFKHSFDWTHPLLSFTSWYSNYVRAKLWHVLYLDHCLFFPSSAISAIFPLPEVEIFEDTYLSYRLRHKFGRPLVLSEKVMTSAIRFREKGIWYQALMNQILKLKFHLGVSSKKINRPYEVGLELNSKI